MYDWLVDGLLSVGHLSNNTINRHLCLKDMTSYHHLNVFILKKKVRKLSAERYIAREMGLIMGCTYVLWKLSDSNADATGFFRDCSHSQLCYDLKIEKKYNQFFKFRSLDKFNFFKWSCQSQSKKFLLKSSSKFKEKICQSRTHDEHLFYDVWDRNTPN